MAGIFLSYSRADRAHAYRIVHGLRALGVDVWWDEDMPGVDWQYELKQRINDMAAVLVLWTKNSQNSMNVEDEARLAYKEGKLINALVGLAEPPHPFDRNNGLPIDGWDGREPHRGWSRLVQTAESYLVKAGDTEPGKITAALAALEQDWQDRKQALARAQEAFGDAQTALADAAAAIETATADLAGAQEQLAKAGEMRFSPEIMRAAQQLCDAKAAIVAECEAAHRAARARLSEASRDLKRCTAALQAPAQELPAPPITPTHTGDAPAEPPPIGLSAPPDKQDGASAERERLEREKQAAEVLQRSARKQAEEAVARENERASQELRRRLDAAARAERQRARGEQWQSFLNFALTRRNAIAVAVLMVGLIGAIALTNTAREVPVREITIEPARPAAVQAPPALSLPPPPEAAARKTLLGKWALEGATCTDPVTFAETKGGLMVTFAGETSPITLDPRSADAGFIFRAGDGTRYKLDQNGVPSRLIGDDSIRMTPCAR